MRKEYDQQYYLDKTIWVALLSNNEILYQDDFGDGQPSDWHELRKYIEENNLRIERMQLRFRTEAYNLPEGKDGYFFSKGVSANMFSDEVYPFYIAGYLHNGEVHTQTVKVPELLIHMSDVRDIEKCQLGLIKNPPVTLPTSPTN